MNEIIVGNGWRDKLDALVSRRRDTWVVAAVVALLVAVALLLWARRPVPQVAPPSVAGAFEASPQPTPASVLFVHVSGAVRKPGLYELPSGSRVADAIEVAGGAKEKGDTGALNLAEVLTDAAKVDVPRKGEVSHTTPSVPPTASATPQVVDLNQADAAALETIPGIGPVTAQAIFEHRSEIGRFTEIHELLDVDGIGPATLENIRPYVSL